MKSGKKGGGEGGGRRRKGIGGERENEREEK
jgi:hypothetical protein